MASTSGSFNTSAYSSTVSGVATTRYLTVEWWKHSDNGKDTIQIYWKAYMNGTNNGKFYKVAPVLITIVKNVGTSYASNHDVLWIDGNSRFEGRYQTSVGEGYFDLPAGSTFGINAQLAIYYKAYNSTGYGQWALPTLAIPPTVPTSVSVSGNNGTWVNKDDPKFSASWSGATAGTYTIKGYSVDVAKYGQGNYTDTGFVETSQTYGSVSNRAITVLGALNGGDKLQFRIGLRTTSGGDGGWWGTHAYWGGTLNVYSSPTAPSTFSVPSSVEIGSNLTISWSGAKGGSNGIAGYDLQGKAYNGSVWTDWTNILVCKNQPSYSAGIIKDLKINGVGYSTNGAGVKFKYRIRTSDGIIATSEWKESGEIGITINSPSAPRKSYY